MVTMGADTAGPPQALQRGLLRCHRYPRSCRWEPLPSHADEISKTLIIFPLLRPNL